MTAAVMLAPLRPAAQEPMFPIESTFGPLALNMAVTVRKIPRRRCTACSNRRVCIILGVSEAITSPPVCMKCAGLR